MATRVFYSQNWPWSPDWSSDGLLVFDRILLRQKGFRSWSRRFPAAYGVKAGEGLKDLRAFPSHLQNIQKLAGGFANRRMTIVVAGGGSVGDFGGFVASIFKRGVRLVNVPTTWLAALDSAHGGKNGLNVGGAKNQIGTIYPASEVRIVASALKSQPNARAIEAGGEALKIALLKGGAAARLKWSPENSFQGLWKALPTVIRGKMSVVEKDPFEKSGVRHLLNLGHTMGHVYEAAFGWPHGLAIAYGLDFALSFSEEKKICSPAAYVRLATHPLWSLYLPSPLYKKSLSLPEAKVRKLLLQDKKRTKKSSLRFVFLKDIGKPVIREVSVDEILREYRRKKNALRGRG